MKILVNSQESMTSSTTFKQVLNIIPTLLFGRGKNELGLPQDLNIHYEIFYNKFHGKLLIRMDPQKDLPRRFYSFFNPQFNSLTSFYDKTLKVRLRSGIANIPRLYALSG